MGWRYLIFVPLTTAFMTLPSQAGIFSRKPKVNPADQVVELVRTLHSDGDERRRSAAAGELGTLDAKTYPAIQPALIDALMKDPSSTVRHEAAQALGRVRPLSSQAAYALQQAVSGDSSTRVRLTARTSLWEYHLAGFRGSNPPPTSPQTPEPPPASALAKSPPPARPAAVTRSNALQSAEPPLAGSSPAPRVRIEAPPAPRIAPPATLKIDSPPEASIVATLPSRPALSAEPKVEAPKPAAKATPKKDDDGPLLNPPG